MAKKSGYVKAIDDCPLIVKVLLSLPFINGIIFGLYRLLNGHLVSGLLWFFLGACILWIVDIFHIVTTGKPKLWAQ